MVKNKIIGLDLSKMNIDLIAGSCGWQWICFDCNTTYCSGCTIECPQYNSKRIRIKKITKKYVDEHNNEIGLWNDDELQDFVDSGAIKLENKT